MRNLKKFLAVLVVVAMMATAMVPVMSFAAAKTDSTICKDLGVLQGDGSGVTAEYLAKTTTRLQAAIMYLRLKGLEADALAYQGTANFADGNISWAGGKAIMAYLKANPDLGWIGDGVNFMPNSLCTAQMYYKVLLEGLGYKQGEDFNWSETLGYAKALGLKKVASVASFTNNDLAIATVEALGTETKGGVKLITVLVDAGIIDSADAVATGLFAAPTIATVENVDLGTVNVGDTVTLPATVSATLSDDSLSEVAVTWTPATINTTVAGTLTSKGAIAGFAAGITASVKVEIVPLAVLSATASNLKEIVVTFNKELDGDTVVVGNFKIDGNEAGAVSLADDKKTVTVTVDTADVCANGESYSLVVKKAVKGTDGVALAADSTTTVAVLDAQKPTVTSMELTGPATITLTFSEPIMTKGTVKINNGVYSVNVPVADDSNTCKVTINAGSLANGNYSVAISGFKDFANYPMEAVTLTLSYAKVTSPLTATIKDGADQNTVVVVFNREVEDLTGTAEHYFYHTFSAWAPDAVATGDNVEYTLTFDTYPIPEGTTNVVVNYDGTGGADSAITDLWGNALAANITLPVTVSADKTAPTVTAIECTDEDKVKITFSEALDADLAQDEDNYVVKNSDGDEVDTAFTAAYDDADDVYTVVLDFAADLAAGTYTVVVSDVQDDSPLYDNIMAATTLEFTVTDATAIVTADTVATDVLGATADDSEIVYVAYPEKMATTGSYSVLTAATYLIDLDGNADGNGDAVALSDDATLEMFGTSGKIVKITIPDLAIVNGTSSIVMGRVSDISGNVTTALSFAEVMTAETAPAIASVEQTNESTLVVTFNKILSEVSADAFQLDVGDVTYDVSGITSALNGDENATVVTVTLSGDFIDYQVAQNADYEDDTSALITAIDLVGDEVTAETGMVAVDATIDQEDVVDKRVPELVADSQEYTNDDDSTIALTFSEDLLAALDDLYAFDLIVKDGDGNTLTAATKYTTAVVGDVLTITITGVDNVDDYTVKSVAAPAYIQDENENMLKAFDAVAKP